MEYFKASKDKTIAKSYGSPAAYVSEFLIRALDRRIAILMIDNPETVKRREAIVKRKTQDGLLLTEPFYKLLIDFEHSKLNFKEFLPNILEQLPEYSD
jgi:hypothetical protein